MDRMTVKKRKKVTGTVFRRMKYTVNKGSVIASGGDNIGWGVANQS